jgi:poly-beta-1,6-N-acetyl-D-glucosamine synthase
VLAVPELAGGALTWPGFGEVHALVAAHLTLTAVLFGVALPDYLLTCVVAVLERQPRLLLLGVFFPFMRMLDAYIGLYAIPAAWLSRSSGRWKSPARRVVDTGDAAGRIPVRDESALGPDPHSPARVAEASHVPG